MNTRITVLTITLLIAISFGLGSEPKKKFATLEQKVEAAKKNYFVGLRSDNEGLVSSCIKLIAKMKLQVPSTDVDVLKEELYELSIEHPSATVRYKAYLASAVCEDPMWFTEDTNVITTDEGAFFIATSHRLQQKLFGLNSN
jgi:hypothetical protein